MKCSTDSLRNALPDPAQSGKEQDNVRCVGSLSLPPGPGAEQEPNLRDRQHRSTLPRDPGPEQQPHLRGSFPIRKSEGAETAGTRGQPAGGAGRAIPHLSGENLSCPKQNT